MIATVATANDAYVAAVNSFDTANDSAFQLNQKIQTLGSELMQRGIDEETMAPAVDDYRKGCLIASIAVYLRSAADGYARLEEFETAVQFTDTATALMARAEVTLSKSLKALKGIEVPKDPLDLKRQ
jgi:hypothetical protein